MPRTGRRGRLVTLLLAVAGLAAAGIPGAAPAAADSGNTFANVFDGLCMDVAFQSLDPGMPIVQLPCDGSDSQHWEVADPRQVLVNGQSRFYYELRNRHSGLCLDVPYGNPDPGQILQQWTCSGAGMQLWTIVADGWSYDIVNLDHGYCVDDKDWSPNPGTGLQTWTCWHAAVQQWTPGS